MSIDMAALLADREAGTEGPWRKGRAKSTSNEIMRDEDGLTVATVSEFVRGYKHISDTNARRIARLPDLEVAYIEAVGLLDGLYQACGRLDGHDSDMYADEIQAARKFLGEG